MAVSKTHTRPLSIVLVAVLLSSSVAFVSIASSRFEEPASSDDGWNIDLDLLQRTGAVTVSGDVRINGKPATTGQTIVSGSKIETASDGIALVDMGPLGRITVGEGTIVTFAFTRELVRVKSECKRTKIEVAIGQVEIHLPRTEKLVAGENRKYRGSVEATSVGANFGIRCVGSRLAALRRPRNGGILAAALGVVSPVLSEIFP